MNQSADIIAVIGPGTVGSALSAALVKAGRRIRLAGRDAAQTATAAEFARAEASSIYEAASTSRIVLLTVNDDAIETVCDQLASDKTLQAGQVVLHCSGALDASSLASARNLGAAVGSWHPLQTFPDAFTGTKRLGGTYFFAEGDEPALETCRELTAEVGGHFVRLAPGGKALYHAAAVVACNYLTALHDAAEQLAAAAGVEEPLARAALAPLVDATLANIRRDGPAAALTGPIARGDSGTVARHSHALAGCDQAGIALLYAAAGLHTVTLAERKGTLGEAAAREIGQLLSDLLTRSRP